MSRSARTFRPAGVICVGAWTFAAGLILASDMQVPAGLSALLCLLLACNAYTDESLRYPAEREDGR